MVMKEEETLFLVDVTSYTLPPPPLTHTHTHAHSLGFNITNTINENLFSINCEPLSGNNLIYHSLPGFIEIRISGV